MDYAKLANTAALSTGVLLQVPEEIIAFMEYLDKNIKPKNILELGLCNGATFYIWCTICQAGGIKLGIDLPNGDWGIGRKRTEAEIEANKHMFQTFAPNSFVLFGDTKTKEATEWVERKLDGRQLDFLFIDADHTKEGAKKDYENYSKFVRSGGCIAFHDIKKTDRHAKLNCEVYKLWDEIEGNKIEFIDQKYDWGGIGVLIKD